MSNSIESALRKRCGENADLGVLLAQWEYDSRLLATALSTISHNFPHYSLHDASHSHTILERIGAVLGERGVAELTATNLWLLLEAAYYHDAGMVASHARKSEDIRSPEFATFVEKCARNEHSGVADAARRLSARTPRVSPPELHEGNVDLLLVYAEFVRARHPSRSGQFVLDPLTHLSVPSPRTALLPARFWHLLAQICRGHGESREFVMQLPQIESGVGGELCHPRFVACMLRLGDLLDLDSGRFCAAVNAMLPRLPERSEAHRAKHEGIRHLVVSTQRIEVLATYTDVEAYLEAEQWFRWLRDELQHQLLSWSDISPGPSIGPLPSLGSVRAQLEGQFVLQDNQRPQFDVDAEKVLELVRGANIYSGPQDAARELVQNAIDATLLRFAYDRLCTGMATPDSPRELREELGKYPIEVTLTRAASLPEKAHWLLKVQDQGIGLRPQDLAFLLRVGSSSRNETRHELRSWLPEWARPSGTFGIGFHSIFEYARRVILRTRHPRESEGLEVTFTKNDAGTVVVVVKHLPTTPYPRTVGTTLQAELEFPPIPKTVNLARDGETQRVLAEYDFVNDEDLPYEPARVEDALRSLAKSSLASIAINGAPPRREEREHLFDRESGTELLLLGTDLRHGGVHTLYRGAPVENRVSLPLITVELNLHSGDARDLLELSRNKLTRRGNRHASDSARAALRRCIPELMEADSRGGGKNAAILSLFASVYRDDPECTEDWKTIELEAHPKPLPLATLACAASLCVHFARRATPGPKPLKWNTMPDGLELIEQNPGDLDRDWFRAFVLKHFPSRHFLGGRGDENVYRFTKGAAEEDVSAEGLRTQLSMIRSRFGVGCRGVLACPKQFAMLTIPVESEGWWEAPLGEAFIERLMPNPFVFIDENSFDILRPDSVVRWLAKLRKEPTHPISRTLIEFLRFADPLIPDEWTDKKRYRLEETVQALAKAFPEST